MPITRDDEVCPVNAACRLCGAEGQISVKRERGGEEGAGRWAPAAWLPRLNRSRGNSG